MSGGGSGILEGIDPLNGGLEIGAEDLLELMRHPEPIRELGNASAHRLLGLKAGTELLLEMSNAAAQSIGNELGGLGIGRYNAAAEPEILLLEISPEAAGERAHPLLDTGRADTGGALEILKAAVNIGGKLSEALDAAAHWAASRAATRRISELISFSR